VTISTEGANQSATGTCTDQAGNTASDTQGGIDIDLTPPSVSAAAAPAPNGNGWNNTDVVVTFSGTDALSGIDACDPPVTISTEGAGQSATGSCTDKAGNSASATASGISIDKTPPTVTATPDRPADHNGWYNHSVTITFSGTDGLSDAVTCDSAVAYSGPDGASVTVSGSCTDAAGNSATASFTFNYDATAPVVTVSPDRGPDHNGWYNHAVTFTTSGSDATSGVDSCTAAQTYSGPDGASVTVSGSCTDAAGNSATGSFTFNYDATAPSISAALDRSPDGTTGWFNLATGAPTVTYTCSDATSGIAGCTDPYTFGEGTGQSHTGTAVDQAGNSATASVTGIDVDLTAPTIAYLGQSPAPNANGWNNSPVTLSWSCTDATSGPVASPVSVTISTEGANQSATGTCTDQAGNTASDTQGGIDIDLTPPTNIQWVGGPADGGAYYFGFVPSAPTCTAEDALSGLASSCMVSGYGTGVGSHTMTATATDRADNVATATRTYSVLAWDIAGFYRPVDPMPTVNTVKAGSTVPLKFEVFAGALELTDVGVVDSLSYRQVPCSAFEDATESPVELTATGGTVLRYDTTAGQFIFNWKTPSTPNKCYKTTLVFDDGSSIAAYFKLK
jgi:hypothetical protein